MKEAAVLREFNDDFGVSFLRGDQIIVGDFLGQTGLAALRYGLTLEPRMVDAWEAQLEQAALYCDVTPAPFDEDAAVFLFAIHELFAACHPQANAFYARPHTFVQAAERAIRALPRSVEAGRWLTRHLVVVRAFTAMRTDVVVKWWSGKAEFWGEEPPQRLLYWPGVRHVDTQRTTTSMWRLALTEGDEETRVARRALMQTMLHYSPLTRLWLLGDGCSKQLGFSLVSSLKAQGRRMSPLDVLDDRHLARMVVDRFLDVGVDQVGPVLSLAILGGIREGTSPWVLRRALEVNLHLAITLCVLEASHPGCPEALSLRQVLEQDIGELHEASRLFWATVKAAWSMEAIRDNAPTPHFEEQIFTLWSQLMERLVHPALDIAEPLVRELRRRLTGAATDTESEPR